jgi:hypothetical protein
MGYYLQTPDNRDKHLQLVEMGGEIIPEPTEFSIPDEGWYVCVVQNGPFDACCVVVDEREFRDCTDREDLRPHTWVLMPDEAVYEQLPMLRTWGEK